ncbi:MAG: LysR family transcriptional regulator [Methylobacter sp.]|jgi:LysR family hydrogen peroxide-inducible transcriptional activator|uniref:LysR family transcriptional regulator n=1 Tax=Methylobacter sp. TaxID=2051955 RepID=UPI0025DF3B8C|nr:LysR family transcriptional regulator [Methylobacter sp.]MCK9621011.1 LysR family transcriptional regulator [Methylobacter sp.]
MEMQQIRYFLAVCDQGSITHAAQLTYVSQPSLTQAIKKLEDEMGGALFTRTRSGCELTPLGRMVEANLRKIYRDLQATKAEAIRFTRLNTVPLRIGLMTTIGAQRLSPCLAWYQQEYPNIELELIVDSEAELLKQLGSGLLDLVISAPAHIPATPYQSTLLYEERYVVAFSPSHRFNQVQKVDLKAIQSEPYLDRLNCELREDLKCICQNEEINLYAAYRSNSEEWILQMVKAGIGVALMPEYTLPKQATDISYRYLSEPEISRQVYAIHTHQTAAKPELQALLVNLSGT